MIDFIYNKDDFEKQSLMKNQIFRLNTLLPDNLFQEELDNFLFFQSDFIYTDGFLRGIQTLINKEGNQSFVFYTLSPDPASYFFFYFKKYSVAIIPINATKQDYFNFLHRDPGGNLADSLWSNGETVGVFSESLDWGLFASKDWEIGVVGFKTDKVKKLFIESFKEDVGPGKIFDTLDSYMEEYNNMFHWKEENIARWNKLRSNYLNK